MQAITLDLFGEATKLHPAKQPDPSPATKEIKIEVKYAGVNPVDWKICEGHLKDWLTHGFPLIPGWDASGIVDAVGESVTEFKIGDPVYTYCRKEVVQQGTYAEFTCVESKHVAHKPSSLSFAQAAAIPLVALTAWQALFDHASVGRGSTILIHAGAGGVGSLAVQLAKYAGATVISTASTKNHPYVKSLGADMVIDYNLHDFTEKVLEKIPGGVDYVFDTVGFETQTKSFECMHKGAEMLCIVNKPDTALLEKYSVTAKFVFVAPNGEELSQIGKLLDSGDLKCPHITEMNIKEVAKAHQLQKTQHLAEKIVLKIEF